MTLEASTRLAGKRCLVTAAGAGIGRATALAYARARAAVLATDIDTHALNSLATERSAMDTSILDATDPEQIAALIIAVNVDSMWSN
jgi:2-keto-3-deoxy-L-fuconate dehydrogenase